jgi:hypothetical protein
LTGYKCQPNILLAQGVSVHVVCNTVIYVAIVEIKSSATAAINVDTLRGLSNNFKAYLDS